MEQNAPFAVIASLIPPHSPLFSLFSIHAALVAAKAVIGGRRAGLDAAALRFVEEAALLHDIGIVEVHEPKLHCHGALPYLQHGVAGRRILEALGLPAHARVAETHVGVGLTSAEIAAQNLPLPQRDMLPVTLAEQCVCWADLFFSKSPGRLHQEKSLAEVRGTVDRYGSAARERFEALHALFGDAQGAV